MVVVGGFGSFWLIPCFSNYVNLWSIDRRERDSHARHPFVPMITPVQSISVFIFYFLYPVIIGYIVAGFGSFWLVL